MNKVLRKVVMNRSKVKIKQFRNKKTKFKGL